MSEPPHDLVVQHVRRASAIAQRSLDLGRYPFGALLVGPDHETVLMEQCNVNVVDHSENVLARNAVLNYTPEFLWTCTIYSNIEPCAMCAGTIYWANIGRVVFGVTEKRLLLITGERHPNNPTLGMSCRTIFAYGQKPITTVGPVSEVEPEIVAMHAAFWKRT